jgi:hypothetical protein
MKSKIQKFMLYGAVLCMAASLLCAQTTWTEIYGGDYDDFCHCATQVSDGGYVAAGRTYSFGKAGQAYVFKTDSAGTILWQKDYGLEPDDELLAVCQTDDNGFFAAGWTKSYGPGLPAANVYLLRLNDAGDTLWTKSYGGTGDDHGYSAHHTQDDGCVIVGSTTTWGAGSDDALLMKLDDDGNTLWIRTYGGMNRDEAQAVECVNDGGYIIAGVTYSFGTGIKDTSNIYIVRTDSLGDTIWTRVYGGEGNQGAWCIRPASDGYIVAGYYRPNGSLDADMFIVRINDDGDTLWSKRIGGASYEDAYDIEEALDGGSLIVGRTSSYGNGGSDSYLVKIDSLGIVQWTSTYGGAQNEFAVSVQLTSDGGYIIAGDTWSFGDGTPAYSNIYMSKTDGNGTVGVNVPGQNNTTIVEHGMLSVCPNPYRERATIKYRVASRGLIELRIYDIQGRLVNIVQKGMQGPGTYSLEWDGRGNAGQLLSAGIYLVRLSCGDRSMTGKIVKLK